LSKKKKENHNLLASLQRVMLAWENKYLKQDDSCCPGVTGLSTAKILAGASSAGSGDTPQVVVLLSSYIQLGSGTGFLCKGSSFA